MSLNGDLRLGFCLLLNGAVLAAAVYAARRWTRDSAQRVLDAMLVWYVVQYAAITIPGLLHVLSTATMTIVALAVAASLVLWSRRQPSLQRDPGAWEGYNYLVAAVFIGAFLLQVIHVQCVLPLIDTDAMTYHAPAAVQWLQTGKLGFFPTWFFNPANTFSPLAGSTFIAWALAPMKGDALARFVQAPAIFLIFLATLQLARSLGAKPLAAGLLGIAAAGCRLCTSEIANPRDDMFLAAFALLALAGFTPSRLRESFGPVRIGLALGLMLATKYTALISLPLVVLMVDAPVAAGWKKRQWLTVIALVLLVAGPWYLRNLLLTGNPLYPMELSLFGHRVLRGLFVTERSERLRTLHGLASVFIEGYHGLPTPLLWVLLAGWATAIANSISRWREPLVRALIFGPPICAAIFLVKSPYGEVRFLYPAIFAVVASTALIARRAQILLVFAFVLMIAAIFTAYNDKEILTEATVPAVVITGFFCGLLLIDKKLGHPARARAYAATVAVLAFVGLVYVYWTPFVESEEFHTPEFWPNHYDTLAKGWKFVRDNVPENAAIAYTQTYLVYPLYGPRLNRHVVYAPTRSDAPDILHLPHFPAPLSGEPINGVFTSLLNASPDPSAWRSRLKLTGAQYLFVDLSGLEHHPWEEKWATASPGFTEIYRDPTVVIFQLAQ